MKKWSWVLLLLCQLGWAQKKWTGNNGTAYWNDPLNWEGDQVPDVADQVLLDNSYFNASYEVVLPDSEVVIQSLEIVPSAQHTIRLLLPVSNTIAGTANSPLVKAFAILGSGYPLIIRKNAVFINASGSASGYAVFFNDSVKVENGGRYIHRTRTGHAEILNKLSRAAGTELGIFRMENTDAASTMSISGRVFGSLELSAASSATGQTTYSASGTNPVLIRGQLLLDSGTTFSLHFGDTIHLAGDLMMQHATLNLSTGNRSSCLQIGGNWQQVESQLIESNQTGHTGTILLTGPEQQTIYFSGGIRDSIRLIVDNPAGITISTSLPLPYELLLKRGVMNMGDSALLLAARATVLLAPDAEQTGIDGKVSKVFEFDETITLPLAKQNTISYLSVRNYTGIFQAEYHRADANIPAQQLAAGLAEISSIEYWTIRTNPAVQVGQPVLEFSYADGQSGRLSDIDQLTVAAYLEGQWVPVGQDIIPDATALKGRIQTVGLSPGQLLAERYSFANKVAGANLLPILLEKNWLTQRSNRWDFNWLVSGVDGINKFEIEFSETGRSFRAIDEVVPDPEKRMYARTLPAFLPGGYCRLKWTLSSGKHYYGPVLKLVAATTGDSMDVRLLLSSGGLQLSAKTDGLYLVEIFNYGGQLLFRKQYKQTAGTAYYAMPAQLKLSKRVIIRLTDQNGAFKTMQQSWY